MIRLMVKLPIAIDAEAIETVFPKVSRLLATKDLLTNLLVKSS